MAKTFRSYLPGQELLLPTSLRDWLPRTTWLFRIRRSHQPDLSQIESIYEGEERGQPPYHPCMMAKVLIYAYCVGVFRPKVVH